MLKNIQKYDILHSIIDDCRQKILKLAERPQGDMNMFKKVGLGFLFVGLAFGVMALCEITRGVGADASVKSKCTLAGIHRNLCDHADIYRVVICCKPEAE